jgi:hypothetical protein
LQERERQGRGCSFECEEDGRRLLRPDRASALLEQLDEAIRGVERELHLPRIANVCSLSNPGNAEGRTGAALVEQS